MSEQPRYQKLNQVRASHHDIACNYAIDTTTCVQLFWYECVNNNLTHEDVERAFKQLQEAKNIQSPYLMNILDISQTQSPSKFIIVTEAIDSPSLADYIRQLVSPPPDKTLIRWFKSIATAVQSIHNSNLNISHGQISLHTVFFRTSPSNIKLSLPISNLSLRYITNQSIDIDPYTAPEKIKGNICKANDIWSLGICLLELLTGEPAYSEMKTPVQLIDALTNLQLPESISKVKNPAAYKLITRCLQGEAFRIDINELLNDPLFNEVNQGPLNKGDMSASQQLLFV